MRTNNWFRQLVDGKMVGISSFKWSDVPADKQDLPHFLMFASALARSTTMLPLDQHSNLGIIPHFA